MEALCPPATLLSQAGVWGLSCSSPSLGRGGVVLSLRSTRSPEQVSFHPSRAPLLASLLLLGGTGGHPSPR